MGVISAITNGLSNAVDAVTESSALKNDRLKYAVDPKGTVADERWYKLNDSMYTAMLNPKSHKYMQCKVILEYPNTDKKISYNLPCYPEEVTNSISTNYQSTEILGRPGQISSYISTGDPTSSFVLRLHRDVRAVETDTDLNAQRNHIDRIVSLIESAQYPYMDSTGGGIYAPIVTYIFGDTMITGKQTSVNTKWFGPKIEGKFMAVDLNISVTNLTYGVRDYSHFMTSNPRGFDRWDATEEGILTKLQNWGDNAQNSIEKTGDKVEDVVNIIKHPVQAAKGWINDNLR